MTNSEPTVNYYYIRIKMKKKKYEKKKIISFTYVDFDVKLKKRSKFF